MGEPEYAPDRFAVAKLVKSARAEQAMLAEILAASVTIVERYGPMSPARPTSAHARSERALDWLRFAIAIEALAPGSMDPASLRPPSTLDEVFPNDVPVDELVGGKTEPKEKP